MTSLKLTLLKCYVLSLKDSCIMYPYCQNCVSRLQRKPTEKRYSCAKCGWTCEVQHVTYRYRLALNVTRDCDIFEVTVFGSCLDPYFGLSATCLQSFLEELEKREGPQMQRLLTKAVEDSFIGRCFVFGVKMSAIDASSCFHDGFPTPLKRRKISGQFVANQIIMPNSAVISCPVLIHLKRLLKAAKWWCPDIDILEEHWTPLAALNHNNCPVPERSDSTLTCHQRSLWEHKSGTLCTAKRCQQLPGLITPSAAEEHSSTECHGNPVTDRQQQRKPNKVCASETPSRLFLSRCWSSDTQEKYMLNNTVDVSSCSAFYACGGESVENTSLAYFHSRLSLLRNAFESSYSSSSSSSSPTSVTKLMNYNSLSAMNNSQIPHFKSDHREHLSLRKESGLSLSNSVAWEDVPFSESLGEFVCGMQRSSEAIPLPENIHSSAGTKDATQPNASYIYELQESAPIQDESFSKHFCSSTKLRTCCPNQGQHEKGSLHLLSIDLSDLICNSDTSRAIVPNSQDPKLEAPVDKINLFSHISCSPRLQENKEMRQSGFSVPNAPTGQQSFAEKGHDSAICDWLFKREATNPQRGLSWQEDVNTSADLFDDYERGTSAAKEKSRGVTGVSPQPQTVLRNMRMHLPGSLNTDGTPRSAPQRKHCTCNILVSEPELSNSIDLVPFFQSTPVSVKMKSHPADCNTGDDVEKRLFSVSESELEEYSPSVNKRTRVSVQKRLACSIKRCMYDGSYRKITSGCCEEGPCGIGLIRKAADAGERSTVLNNTGEESTRPHSSSPQKCDGLEDINARSVCSCMRKGATFTHDGSINAGIGSPTPEHDVSACDASADLFAD